MEIKFISDSGLSPGTVNLIRSLPYNNKFRREIKSTRDAIGIPTDSFSDDIESVAGFLKENQLFNSKRVSNRYLLWLAAYTLVQQFKLPENWVSMAKELLLFDSALVFEEEIVLTLPDSKDKTSFVSINIHGKISRNKLDRWLDKNWDTIENYFETLRFKKPSKVNRKRIALKTEVLKLYSQGKPLNEISDELGEKYGDDEETANLVSDVELLRLWIQRIELDIET